MYAQIVLSLNSFILLRGGVCGVVGEEALSLCVRVCVCVCVCVLVPHHVKQCTREPFDGRILHNNCRCSAHWWHCIGNLCS